MEDKSDLRLESPQVSTLHPAVCPLGVTVYSKDSILGIDIIISSIPPPAEQPLMPTCVKAPPCNSSDLAMSKKPLSPHTQLWQGQE
eukprot:11869541-Ditylum_brightwellii.AAC.1